MSPKKNKKDRRVVRDKHLLYSAAVQSVDADIEFFERVYRRQNGKRFELLKEDFCGTAALACEWVRKREGHRALGVDLHGPTLDWGRQRYISCLKPAEQKRIKLIEADVLKTTNPKVDVVAALNFSYSVFHEREQLGAYFRAAHRSLKPRGLFILDVLGGQETAGELFEKRKIDTSKAWDGTKVPAFEYRWEQARFNPIDHRILCKIHFKLRDGSKLKDAFVYDWRLWTLPEIGELMLDAGFKRCDVYTEGWDEEAQDGDGVFRKRKRFENQEGWVAYAVGVR